MTRKLRHPVVNVTNVLQHAVILTLAVSMMLVSNTAAQSISPVISVKSGLIRNLQEKSVDLPRYALYTEAQIGRKLGTFYNGLIATSGELYAGYWDDGINKISEACRDCITYSHRSYITGIRFYVDPYAFPLDLLTGLSYHFLQAHYVGGAGADGSSGTDYRDRFGTWEAGVRLAIPFANRLAVNAEVQAFIPLSRHNRHRVRPSVKLGAYRSF